MVLIHRNPLAALTWVFEATRLLRRRREKARRQGGDSRGRLKAHSIRAGEQDALDQIIKVVTLVERLLRTTQAGGLNASKGESEDAASVSEDDILLPTPAALEAASRHGQARSRTGGGEVQAKQQLWPSVLEARLWLEAEMDVLIPRSNGTKLPKPQTSDDVEDNNVPGSSHQPASSPHQAHASLLMIKALAQTHSVCNSGLLEKKMLDSLKTVWQSWQDMFPAVPNGEVKDIVEAVNALLTDLEGAAVDGAARMQAIKDAGVVFWRRLNDSLPESRVDVDAKMMATQRLLRSSSKAIRPQPKRPNVETRRRRSLEDLRLVDSQSTARKGRPSLLTHAAPTVGQSTAASPRVACEVDHAASTLHPPRPHFASSRAFSHSGVTGAAQRKAVSGTQAAAARSVSSGDAPKANTMSSSPSPSRHLTASSSYSPSASRSKRPSSIMSDSPSLLFGDAVDAEDSSFAAVEGSALSQPLQQPRAARRTVSNTVTGALPSQSGPEGMPAIRRTPSLYGDASLTLSSNSGVGSNASAYGHVGNTGTFDPTASLRETQYRRKRAESNASTATTASMYSTRATRDEKVGHLQPDIVLATPTRTLPEQKAADSLKKQLSSRQLADLRPPSTSSGHMTPMLTERLEQKLAASYAAQRPGLSALRSQDGQSMRSRASNASRFTGLASLRTPSLLSFGPAGSARIPTLSFFAASSKPAKLSTSAAKVEAQSKASATPQHAKAGDDTTTTKSRGAPLPHRSAESTLKALHAGRARGPSSSKPVAVKSDKPTPQPPANRPALAELTVPQRSASNSQPSPATGTPALRSVRSFSLIDPSSSAYASQPSPLQEPTKQSLLSPMASGLPSPRAGGLKSCTGSAHSSLRALHQRPSSSSLRSSHNVNNHPGSDQAKSNSSSPPESARSVRFDDEALKRDEEQQRASSARKALRPSSSNSSLRSAVDLDPALADAEDASKLKTSAGCEACGTLCINAPIDRKGRKFCSRRCRVEYKAAHDDTGKEDKDKGSAAEVSSRRSCASITSGSEKEALGAAIPAQAVRVGTPVS